jgi:hypothetical protein
MSLAVHWHCQPEQPPRRGTYRNRKHRDGQTYENQRSKHSHRSKHNWQVEGCQCQAKARRRGPGAAAVAFKFKLGSGRGS